MLIYLSSMQNYESIYPLNYKFNMLTNLTLNNLIYFVNLNISLKYSHKLNVGKIRFLKKGFKLMNSSKK